MSERVCAVEGCDRTGKLTRAMCGKHYRYWIDHTPIADREPAPRFARAFEDFFDQSGECWVWTGPRNRKGYGLWSGGGEKGLAHRIALKRVRAPADPSLFACHRCDNPSCVNPRHLYWGTVRDNTDDMLARGGVHNRGKFTSHCPRGHEKSGDNLRLVGAKRFCRACDNEGAKKRAAEPVPCAYCGATIRKGNLSRHERVHHAAA